MINEYMAWKEPTWTRHTKILLTFAAAGLIAGFCFAFVTSLESLRTFWFVKYDKFWSPKLTYYMALSLTLLIGLIAAFFSSQEKFALLVNRNISILRKLNTILLIALSTSILYLISPTMGSLFSLLWVAVYAPIAFIALLALSFCILLNRLRDIGTAAGILILTAALGFFFVGVGVKILEPMSDYYDFIQWPLLDSALNVGCAIYLLIAESRFNRGNA